MFSDAWSRCPCFQTCGVTAHVGAQRRTFSDVHVFRRGGMRVGTQMRTFSEAWSPCAHRSADAPVLRRVESLRSLRIGVTSREEALICQSARTLRFAKATRTRKGSPIGSLCPVAWRQSCFGMWRALCPPQGTPLCLGPFSRCVCLAASQQVRRNEWRPLRRAAAQKPWRRKAWTRPRQTSS